MSWNSQQEAKSLKVRSKSRKLSSGVADAAQDGKDNLTGLTGIKAAGK